MYNLNHFEVSYIVWQKIYIKKWHARKQRMRCIAHTFAYFYFLKKLVVEILVF